MAKTKKGDFFWVSYADLMTSLFFVMLVLFVLTVVILKEQQKATEQQLKIIKEVQNAVKELPKEHFEYDLKYKRFSLIKKIEFQKKQAVFQSDDDRVYLTNVGKSIKDLIDRLKRKYADQDIKFIILIEGMASDDNYPENFQLSYERALSVKKLWDEQEIILDESMCEVQIAGSGTKGIGRFPNSEEWKNQRILIQVIPKIGELKTK